MPLATTTKDGSKVKCSSFAIRLRLRDLVSPTEYNFIKRALEERRKKGNIFIAEYPEADNGDMHDWVMVGDDKYSRAMYCLKTREFRHLTMGEFYENSPVD